MKIFLKTILFISIATAGMAEETFPTDFYGYGKAPSPIPPITISEKGENVSLYGSLSLLPGPGLSFRERTEGKGRAIDVHLGAIPTFGFGGGGSTPLAACIDYNFLYFYENEETGTLYYRSWGLGVAIAKGDKTIPIPYVPLRMGTQFKYGFVDLGIGVLFSPELRAGFSTPF